MMTIESRAGTLKVAAGLAMLGAFLGLIANSLHPHLTNPTVEEFLAHVAARPDWTLLHLTIILSIICILGGLFGIYRSILNEPAVDLARLGFALAVVGTTLVAVNVASDGMAMKYIANQWAGSSAADQAALLPAATVLDKVNLSFYTIWIFLFLGLPFALYSLALLRSTVYPRWLGWLGLLGGVGCAVVGMMQYVGGETTLLTTLFLVFSIDITIWVFVMGLFLWRKAAAGVVR
jgi:hypothetical protein